VSTRISDVGSRLRWSRWAFRALACAFGGLGLAVLAAVGWAVTAAFDRSLASVLRTVTVAAGALCLASLVAFVGLKVGMDRSAVSRLRRQGMAVRADVLYVLDLTIEPERFRWANLELCLSLHLPNGGTRESVYSGIVARDLADRLLTMETSTGLQFRPTVSVFADPYRPDPVRIFLDGTASLAAPATAYVALSAPLTRPMSRLARRLAEVDRIRTGGLPALTKLVAAEAECVTLHGDLVVRIQAVVVPMAVQPQFLAVWRQRVAMSARPLLVAGAELPACLTARDRHHVALDLSPEIDPPPSQQAGSAAPAPRRPRWSRRRWTTVIASVLVLIAAVGLVVRWVASPATAGLPEDTSLLTCDGTRYPDAAPYGGPPPHPIVILIQGGYDQVGNQWDPFYPVTADTGGPSSTTDTGAPSSGTVTPSPALSSPWSPDDVRSVQLIACARRSSLGSSEVAQCEYQISVGRLGQPQIGVGPAVPVSMYTGTFQIDLYELRTHRHIFSTTITGLDTTCPQTLPESVSEIASQPTQEQFVAALNGFVNLP
jgi:hypothetical protein